MISEFKVLHPRVHGSTLLHPLTYWNLWMQLAVWHKIPKALISPEGCCPPNRKRSVTDNLGHRKRPRWMWLRIRVECSSCSTFFSFLLPSGPAEVESHNRLEVCRFLQDNKVITETLLGSNVILCVFLCHACVSRIVLELCVCVFFPAGVFWLLCISTLKSLVSLSVSVSQLSAAALWLSASLSRV